MNMYFLICFIIWLLNNNYYGEKNLKLNIIYEVHE